MGYTVVGVEQTANSIVIHISFLWLDLRKSEPMASSKQETHYRGYVGIDRLWISTEDSSSNGRRKGNLCISSWIESFIKLFVCEDRHSPKHPFTLGPVHWNSPTRYRFSKRNSLIQCYISYQGLFVRWMCMCVHLSWFGNTPDNMHWNPADFLAVTIIIISKYISKFLKFL